MPDVFIIDAGTAPVISVSFVYVVGIAYPPSFIVDVSTKPVPFIVRVNVVFAKAVTGDIDVIEGTGFGTTKVFVYAVNGLPDVSVMLEVSSMVYPLPPDKGFFGVK